MNGFAANDAPGRGIAGRLSGFGDLSATGKCLVVAFITLPFAGGMSAVAEMLLRTRVPDEFDPHWLRIAALFGWSATAGWVAIVLWGIFLYNRGAESRALTHATVQLYGVSNMAFAYTLGFETNPWAVVVLLGAGIVGLLLFDRSVALWGLAVAISIPVATTVANLAGWIPYAPMLRKAPFGGGTVNGWWRLSMGGFGSMAVLLALGLIDRLIREWRDREEKLAEAHLLLKAQKDQLVRAESLAAVGSLVSGAAHELRNPLASSSGILQELHREIASAGEIFEPQKREILQSLEVGLRGQQRAAAIVERLYALSDALARSDPDIQLAAVVEAIAARYPRLAVRDRARGISARVSRKGLETVLANVIDNAFAAGGAEPPVLEVDLEDGEVSLVVSDSGRGIPAAQQSEVFKPFFTGSKAGEGHGVGLGLYIVHELALRMGGSVMLESDVGRGTRVRVRLPAG